MFVEKETAIRIASYSPRARLSLFGTQHWLRV